MVRLAPSTGAPKNRACVVRIELSVPHRRHLDAMARDAGVSADTLASRMMATLLSEDAAAHGEGA